MRDNSAGQPTDLIEAQNSLDVKTGLFGRRACRLEALEEILLRARLERARVRTPAGGRQKEVGGGSGSACLCFNSSTVLQQILKPVAQLADGLVERLEAAEAVVQHQQAAVVFVDGLLKKEREKCRVGRSRARARADWDQPRVDGWKSG